MTSANNGPAFFVGITTETWVMEVLTADWTLGGAMTTESACSRSTSSIFSKRLVKIGRKPSLTRCGRIILSACKIILAQFFNIPYPDEDLFLTVFIDSMLKIEIIVAASILFMN